MTPKARTTWRCTGHVRPVAHTLARLREAERFGFGRVAAPSPLSLPPDGSPMLVRVTTLREALELLG